MSRDRLDFVPLAPVVLVKPNGLRKGYGLGAASDTDRGTALLAALAAITAGDSIYVGPGTFDCGASRVVAAAKCSFIGSGRDITIVKTSYSNANLVTCYFPTDSRIIDVTIQATTGPSQFTCGAVGSDPLTTGVQFIRCHINSAGQDTFLVTKTGSRFDLLDTDLTMTNTSLTDGLVIGNIADIEVRMVGGLITVNQGRAVLANGNGLITCLGVRMRRLDENGSVFPVVQSISSGNIRLLGCSIQNDSTDPTLGILSAGTLSIDAATTWNGTASGHSFLAAYGTIPTAAGLALLDDANAAAQRVTLGVQKKVIQFHLMPVGVPLSTGDGQAFFVVPAALNGAVITAVRADVGSTGGCTFQLRRVRSATPVDVLSTAATIDNGETSTDTAAIPAVINAANDDLATGDRLYVDVDAATTTVGEVVFTVEVTL